MKLPGPAPKKKGSKGSSGEGPGTRHGNNRKAIASRLNKKQGGCAKLATALKEAAAVETEQFEKKKNA
jgi:hypothetical protein